jgi:hypothetical protein
MGFFMVRQAKLSTKKGKIKKFNGRRAPRSCSQNVPFFLGGGGVLGRKFMEFL